MAELQEHELEPDQKPKSGHELAAADLEGEPGHPGHDPYAAGPHKPQPEKLSDMRLGSPADAAKSWANSMMMGAAPQAEGALGAMAKAAVQPLEHRDKPQDPHEQLQELLDAYRSVRNAGAAEHAQSDNTVLGHMGNAAAYITPHPLIPTPTAAEAAIPALGKIANPVAKRAVVGGAVGTGVGMASGAANSPADLTKMDPAEAKRFLYDTFKGGAGGLATGATLGAGSAMAEGPTRALSQEQALRAAGLQAGIKNSIQKDLGVENMEQARELGQEFLDKGLIPPVGSSEAVAKRAQKLQDNANNAVGATLNHAELNSGMGFDYPEAANAMRQRVTNPTDNTATAIRRSDEALKLAQDMEDQGKLTPGSFVGANKQKSDSWKGVNFSANPELDAVQTRKAVSGARQSIEDQVARTLGPKAAQDLHNANQNWGTAEDALKLAANESTRRAARKGITVGDVLPLLAGSTAGGAMGHSTEGLLTGLATTTALKGFDKYGHSSLARGAQGMATKLGESSGGHAGGLIGQDLEHRGEEELRPSDDEEEHRPWDSLDGGTR
jgi:hypothetical protein